MDCANGVGALKLQQMVPQLQQLGLNLVLYNTGEGRLNHLCGADYVQKEQTYPAGWVVLGGSTEMLLGLRVFWVGMFGAGAHNPCQRWLLRFQVGVGVGV